MAEYDLIAQNYRRINQERPLYRYLVYPRFFEAVGDVRGKSVLDLACGYGLVARQLKARGASRVVGVDLSEKMLEIAKQEESESPLGVGYQQGRVGELGKLGEFDVVAAAFLLHYATSKDELTRMCRDIEANLKPGGIFVTINNNPEHPTCKGMQYENRVEADVPLKEGGELRVTLDTGDVRVSFVNYYWAKNTYQQALSAAGLRVEWLPVLPTAEGIEALGESYWENFVREPFFVIMKCTKI